MADLIITFVQIGVKEVYLLEGEFAESCWRYMFVLCSVLSSVASHSFIPVNVNHSFIYVCTACLW